MLVSVIIPVYNAQEYLEECVRSVMKQTLRDLEIICIDDGSTDGSPDILSRLAKEDHRVIVHRVPNGGAGAARNIGMQLAGGKYFSFLDADDFFAPYMLEKLCEKAEKDHAQITLCEADLYDHKRECYLPCRHALKKHLLPQHRPFAAQDIQKDIFKTVIGWPWDKLFLASYIRQIGLQFQEQRTTNDAFFVFSSLVRAQKITVVESVLVHHRKYAGMTLSVTREKSWMCFYQMLVRLREQLQEWSLYERFKQDFINYALHFSLWNLQTLNRETQQLLYDRLKEEWLENLGITEEKKEFFYSKSEYLQMQLILRKPYTRWVSLLIKAFYAGSLLRHLFMGT